MVFGKETKTIYTSVYTVWVMKFVGKIWKVGNSYVVTIPSDYIKTEEFGVDELVLVKVSKKKEEGD